MVWPMKFRPQQLHICAFGVYEIAIARIFKQNASIYERYVETSQICMHCLDDVLLALLQ